MTVAFGQQVGQGWEQVGLLAVAFVLSLMIGTEREAQQKSAGMRTYTLVGVGAALFVLLSKYGFTDILGGDVRLDPSRVAAQIVTGIGFLGAGLIFVRRDAVHGLTSAASVWLTAAIGAAAGGGLVVLAAVTTGIYLVTVYALRPVARWVQGRNVASMGLVISYMHGYGVMPQVLEQVSEHGFTIEHASSSRGTARTFGGRGTGREGEPGTEELAQVEVILVLSGAGDLHALATAIGDLPHVVAVRTGPGEIEA